MPRDGSRMPVGSSHPITRRCLRTCMCRLPPPPPLKWSSGLPMSRSIYFGMARRPSHQRKNKPGRFADWPSAASTPRELSEQVVYTGHPKHKDYTSHAGPGAFQADDYKCDFYPPEQWPLLQNALRLAIRSGSVAEFRGRFPKRAWVRINGVLHEARQSGYDSREYHGFPIDDPRHYPLPISRLNEVPNVEIPPHRI